MSVSVKDLKYNIFDVLGRFDRFRGYSRSAPAVVGLCVHCERIFDDTIYNKLLHFSKYFNGLTGERLIVCVSTPLNPATDRTMREIGFEEDVYRERLEALLEFCEIGYHGHFYVKKEGEFIAINGDNPHIDVATGQIDEEFGWFRRYEFKPRKYIAGWWFLNKDIIFKLESEGIEADFSIRSSGRDTFGGFYLRDNERPSLGKPFILPPSKRVVEIQTVFGPTSHPYRVGKLLEPYMNYDRQRNIYFVFSIHDWDLLSYYREIKKSVEFVSESSKDFVWSNFGAEELTRIRDDIGKSGVR